MSGPAASPRYHPHSHSRPHTSTPTSRHTTTKTASVGQNLAPSFFSPRPVATPHHHPHHDTNSNLNGNGSHAHRSVSPNYFGNQNGQDGGSMNDPSHHSRQSRSSLEGNPDFDAFRRESEGKAFNLGGLGDNFQPNGSSVSSRRVSENGGQSTRRTSRSKDRSSSEIKAQAFDPTRNQVSRSPKRVLSPGSIVLPEESNRRVSPPSYGGIEREQRKSIDRTGDSQPRFALPLDTAREPKIASMRKAETLPATSDADTTLLTTPQHIINLLESKLDDVLLLDLRVATQYAKSHILGALNLCMPTTLLKRPSFNVQKLANTFKDDRERRKFETWRTGSHIVVYDGSSAALKDAAICLHTIKKFRSEGYDGTLYIIKGGFAEFSRHFPSYVENGEDMTVNTDGPEVAPVAGGCPMPASDEPANPFFGNIRQNMDLIGGVGQIPLQHPPRSTSVTESGFPEWLKKAADNRDQGEKVSRKFEQIERREKKRMEDALSGKVTWDSGSNQASPTQKNQQQQQQSQNGVQIAGLEKGSKNRYNNIWPFEHSRVKLEGVPKNGCDYFNANFIQAAWSDKRYISTQAPIPATFNDFWNVVWQQDIRVIVMLTAEKEGAQLKAHNYWEKDHYGPLHLDLLSDKRVSVDPVRFRKLQQQQRHQSKRTTSSSSNKSLFAQLPSNDNDEEHDSDGERPYVTVRRFTLSHAKFPFQPLREITQLHYPHWPDFGAPAHPAHLLGLVELTGAAARRSAHAPPSKHAGTTGPDLAAERPILVHCSAGCGRTGTFCTVDSVIDMLKRQRLERGHDFRWAAGAGAGATAGAGRMDLDTAPPPTRPRKAARSNTHGSDDSSCSSSAASYTGNGNGNGEGEGEDSEVGRRVSSTSDWVHRDDLDLVEKTVQDFRSQRLSMVQSLRQFVLCYESIMEWLVLERRTGADSSS